jgi:methyl-accepting chemotaxis protein PixJ
MTQTSPQQPNQEKKIETENNVSSPTNQPSNNGQTTSSVNVLNNNSNTNKITPKKDNSQGIITWWQNKNLRFKTTSVAITLGILPIIFVGTIISGSVNTAFRNQIEKEEISRLKAVSRELNSLLNDRYLDIQTLAEKFSDFPAFQTKNKEELAKELNKYQKLYRYYDSIAIFDIVEQEGFVENLATEVIRQVDDINLALEKIQ